MRLLDPEKPHDAPIFRPPATPAPLNPIPSSSPAFATPAHPIRPFIAAPISKPTILPIILPPTILRPLAFRTFTKKHSLTITSTALQVLATFIGKHCGSEWREQGLAEQVLEEVAKAWKRASGGVIVDGEGKELKEILKNLEGNMSGGRIIQGRGISRQNSLLLGESQESMVPGFRPSTLGREDSQSSLGMSTLEVEDEDEEIRDARKWLKVIDAFEQPRLVYNVGKKHFEKDPSKPSLLPPPSHKTQVFRSRYNLIHQRLLRNESFQARSFEAGQMASLRRSSSALATVQQSYKLTPIANLLGRNGSKHLLLGLLTIAPAGTLAINDLTGSISLDLSQAVTIPEDGAWFVPGMIVLVDGVYEEEDDLSGGGLGGGGGVGGTIGGKFIGFTVGGPPSERRQVTLGVSGSNENGDLTTSGGFGWVDFLGVGSSRAVGSRMAKLEHQLLGRPSPNHEAPNPGPGRMIIIGEVTLDQPRTLQALRKLFTIYTAEPAGTSPLAFILTGNFVQHATMARSARSGSIEYKEAFDGLAALLSDFPSLLQHSTFIFVPGDHDGWASSFGSGAATVLPRKPVPAMFTSRVKRVFAAANAEAERETGKRTDGEAVWTTNPARLTLFGPANELVLFRDDVVGRLRRGALRFKRGGIENEVGDGGGDVDMDIDAPSAPSDVIPSSDPLPSSPSDTPMPPPPPTTITPPPSQTTHTSRKLIKTLLDQAHLSPFPLSHRPLHWDYASSLQLYPLPTALVLVDAEAPPFCVTYEGCHVMNPGPVVAPGRRGVVRWVEYSVGERVGEVREGVF